MFTVYFVVAVVIASIATFLTVVIFCAAAVDSAVMEGLKVGSAVLFSGLVIALVWPVLVVSAVPALLGYGAFNTARAIKHKGFDYV